MPKTGRITPNGVVLKEHENATVVFLTEQGFDVELIPKSNVSGIHTPDIIMLGEQWEMKAPKGEGKSLMKNTVQKGRRQSPNLIIDLRRTKRYQDKCLREIQREFDHSKTLNKIKVILKSRKIIDISK